MMLLLFVTWPLVLLLLANQAHGIGQVMVAINCGGESLIDSNGIRYTKDPLTDIGIASDYGRMLDIKRVPAQDKPLYQTERYSTESFGYTVPLPSADADYVLWLKFSEVWFNAPNQKVFDIALNGAIVVNELDIFDKVGRGVAHDEYVGFQIRAGKILINGKAQPFSNEIRIEFIKVISPAQFLNFQTLTAANITFVTLMLHRALRIIQRSTPSSWLKET